MAGHHKFNQLIENISPERKAKIAQKTAQLKQEIALNELQSARQGLKPLANSESPLKWTEEYIESFSRF